MLPCPGTLPFSGRFSGLRDPMARLESQPIPSALDGSGIVSANNVDDTMTCIAAAACMTKVLQLQRPLFIDYMSEDLVVVGSSRAADDLRLRG